MEMKEIDIKNIENLIKNAELNKEIKMTAINPHGSVVIFKRKKNVVFFWRVYIEGKPKKIKIGVYDPKLPIKKTYVSECGTVSILGAIRVAENFASKHQEYIKVGGYLAYLEQEQEKEKQLISINKKQQNNNVTPEYTLLTMFEIYLEETRTELRRKNLRRIFKKDVLTKSADIMNKSIELVTVDDLSELVRRAYRPEAPSIAREIRASLLAMIRRAIKSKVDVTINPKYTKYIVSNELTSLPTITNTTGGADKNPLSEREMWTYYHYLDCIDGNTRFAEAWALKRLYLKLHLLTGGQRIAQLTRLKYKDINYTEEELVLSDSKGRGGLAKKIIKIPFTKQIKMILTQISNIQSETYGKGEYVFTLYGKKDVKVSEANLSRWAKELVKGEIIKFQLKRIRSGVETFLASVGASNELRGRLQSHGNSNIQDKHYNGYHYKRELLTALNAIYVFVSSKEFISTINRDQYGKAINDLAQKLELPIVQELFNGTELATLRLCLSTYNFQPGNGNQLMFNMQQQPNQEAVIVV